MASASAQLQLEIRFLVEFHVANLSSSMKKFAASCHRCPCNECLLCAPFDLLYFGEQSKRTAGAVVSAPLEGGRRERRRGSSGVLSLRIVLNGQWLNAAASAEQLKIFA